LDDKATDVAQVASQQDNEDITLQDAAETLASLRLISG